jgi:hypothetical protein
MSHSPTMPAKFLDVVWWVQHRLADRASLIINAIFIRARAGNEKGWETTGWSVNYIDWMNLIFFQQFESFSKSFQYFTIFSSCNEPNHCLGMSRHARAAQESEYLDLDNCYQQSSWVSTGAGYTAAVSSGWMGCALRQLLHVPDSVLD